MKATFIILALVGSVLFVGCAHLHRSEVISIAKQAAALEGYHLGAYKRPTARFEIGPEGKTWSVSFDGKDLIPGNFFEVMVDDRTRETRIVGGL
jgi:hypothetical protein